MIEEKEALADKDGWLITADRYVAYIDIMGFKDMVARKSHNYLYQLMKTINTAKKTIEKLSWD